jgi:hypothetical protein
MQWGVSTERSEPETRSILVLLTGSAGASLDASGSTTAARPDLADILRTCHSSTSSIVRSEGPRESARHLEAGPEPKGVWGSAFWGP